MGKKLIYVDKDSFERCIFEIRCKYPNVTRHNTYDLMSYSDMINYVPFAHKTCENIRKKGYVTVSIYNRIDKFFKENIHKNKLKKAKDIE